jgi:hypothetical protein
MPSLRDKLLLNSGGLAAGNCAVAGNADGLQDQFSTALIIAREIEDKGYLWHPDVLKFRDRVKEICTRIDIAQDDYIEAQTQARLELRSLTDEMREWFDLMAQKPPTP